MKNIDASIVVTGATSGIGEAITRSLAASGRHIIAIGRKRRSLRSLEAANDNVIAYRMDLRDDKQVRAFGRYAKKRGLRIGGLVHAAGIYRTGSFKDTSLSTLDDFFHVNVRAPFLLTQVLLDSLKTSRGCIVFVNSSAGLTGRALNTAYSATKFALRGLADSIRDEVNDAGIRVLSVFPGRTATPGMAKQFQRESRPYRPEVLIRPDDIATIVVHALNTPSTTELTEIVMRPAQKSY